MVRVDIIPGLIIITMASLLAASRQCFCPVSHIHSHIMYAYKIIVKCIAFPYAAVTSTEANGVAQVLHYDC